jgi:predicted nucleic acid-binding protein
VRPLVVDASVIVPWIVPEAASEAALRLRGRELLAPDLLFSEAANALWEKIVRGELTVDEAETAAHLLAAVPLAIRPTRELLPRAVRLAAELAHPAYDCIYLALAEAEGTALVSDDRRLARVVVEQAGGRYRALVLPLAGVP